jgi:hypothetical protein
VSATAIEPQRQLGLFQSLPSDPIATSLREKLAAIDIDHTTPLDALRLLAELRKEAE